MTTSTTSICNQSLAAIGTRSTIVSLTEESPEAGIANLYYDQTVKELLRKYQWGWARRQKYMAVLRAAQGTPLNPTGTLPQPPLPWQYEYVYPSDCANAICILPIGYPTTITGVPLTTAELQPPIWPRTPPIRFILSGDLDDNNNPVKVVLTNQYQAILVYTAYVTEPYIWDDLFIAALIGRLAAKFVIPLAGDKKLAEMAINAGLAAEKEAETQNGNEGIAVADVTPDWLNARGYDDYNSGGDLYLGGVITDIN